MKHPITYEDTQINQGGLMRCCIKTIYDYIDKHSQKPFKAMTLNCTYEGLGNQRIALTPEGIWKWNHE